MSMIGNDDRYERRAHAMIATMDQAGCRDDEDRRDQPRPRVLTRGRMEVECEEGSREIVLYTRDVTDEGVGFVGLGHLHPYARGTVELPGPDGEPITVVGELVRSRLLASGWHEGYVRFDTPVKLFCERPIRAA